MSQRRHPEARQTKESALYIVATPIGNLGDISSRALAVLGSVDMIAAEDTRHSARLLQHYGISTPVTAYHDFSPEARESALLDRLARGETLALISDAGTPLISDPGYNLVVRVRAAGHKVIPVPGPSALVAALSSAGLPSDRFVFEGFLPARRAARVQHLQGLQNELRTLVCYESPHRIVATLEDMLDCFGPARQVVLCRELTKTFETIHGDSLSNLLPWIQADENRQRGEFVILIAGATVNPDQQEEDDEAHRILTLLLEELPVKQAAAMAARITGQRKNQLYRQALAMQTGPAETRKLPEP
ncbi:MAG: 16S rRNA (cytidine(1402)-2'-O)-methyltransferase [Pseudomonadales bacterium]|nr:16S rRNA (cytidine(1402)-2'-O)-methyltransferase [Pseudomonadales bacterium]